MANQKRHNRNRRRKEFEGDCKSSLGMGTMLKAFTEYQQIKNFSDNTSDTRRKHCNDFIVWCDKRSLVRVDQVNRPILQRYQKHLFFYRTKDDKPLSFRSQLHRLSSIRVWYAWLTRNNYLLSNPASELELPKVGKSLPKQILSPQDAELVLNQTDVTSPLGIRDRSIMETFYSTGIRRSELAGLDVYDLDTRLGILRIRSGKGNKDRVVPIGARAIQGAVKYQYDIRPGFVTDPSEQALYLGAEGLRLSGYQLGSIVRGCIDAAETGKSGSCHLFRHSMATAMLENGADIRYIQAILGHASLETTQIYTQVSIQKLKEIHTATHPAKNEKNNDDETKADETKANKSAKPNDSKPSAGTPGSSTDGSPDAPHKPK
jgi:integrase/recombinase XerD